MPRYLNGKAEEAIKKATTAVLGVPEQDVTPEFLAKEEQEVARRRRLSAAKLKTDFQTWRRGQPSRSTRAATPAPR